MSRRLPLALVALLLAAPALAKEKAIRQFKEKDIFAVVPTKAYILFRSNVEPKTAKPDFLFVRDLTAPEIAEWKTLQADAEAKRQKKLADRLASLNATRVAAHQKPLSALPEQERDAIPVVPSVPKGVPNVVRTDGGRTVAKTETERTYLVEVPAGRYLIAGQSFDGMIGGTCMCMGSVRFDAAAGKITDLGYVLAAPENATTDEPELATMANDPDIKVVPWIMVVRAATPSMSRPPQIGSVAVEPARYVAADKFPNYFGMLVNRMPTMPGILSYRGDKVVGASAEAPLTVAPPDDEPATGGAAG